MDYLVLIHIVSISFWLGVISVEVIFERAKMDKGSIVLLHKLTDRYVELPIILIVFITGVLLWERAAWSTEFIPKVLFGFGAIALNVLCYYFVEKRTIEPVAFLTQSTHILWVVFPGIFCFVSAAYLGGSHAGWW
ncbi:MAG: hypothetical protein QF535_21980 [Anaerolineales bacterium]|jgi:hypothetical protein|nr:hypothetical protein [Anaerolineales bacterium]|tara:strand:+ start:875 stop:1279 length:405 start_codon:yes stop_codon:yes gene_type:complete